MFADITGFTRLVESVEPEDVYDVVHSLLADLVAIVRAEGGEVQQVLGDGFMAVFGLRTRRGDEAERAVRAGLAAVAGGPGRPPVHVGLEYGEVLITPGWQSAGFGVWGRAVTLAQRLCATAGPGQVQIGPAAYARAGHRVGPAVPATVALRGIEGPVAAYRAVAQRSVGLPTSGITRLVAGLS
jgi:class 3 adenylate cyclase